MLYEFEPPTLSVLKNRKVRFEIQMHKLKIQTYSPEISNTKRWRSNDNFVANLTLPHLFPAIIHLISKTK